MSRASKYIYSFLDDHLGVYNNQQGIEFIVNNDDSVIVNYVIKDLSLEEQFELGLCYTSNDFNDFLRDFGFAGTKQLKASSPQRLWELYDKGQADIYCVFSAQEFYFPLYFRREDNKMTVCDDHDNKYELDEILETPRQFADYTRQQFLFY